MDTEEKFMEIAMTYELFKQIDTKRKNLSNDSIQDKENKIINAKNPVENFILDKTIYKKTTKEIFKIMTDFEFQKSKSVDKQYDIHLKNSLTNYDYLEKVNLFTHSLNVAYEASIDNKPKNIKSVNILLSLLHDFGKNSKVKNLYNSRNQKLSHEKVSALFVEEFFADQIFEGNSEITNDLLKVISKTIKIQHSSFVATSGSYLYNLREYDKSAREKELLMLKRLKK